jgi:hypothetical protein
MRHSEADVTSSDTIALRRLALAWFDATGLTAAPPEWLTAVARETAPSMPTDLAPAMLQQPPFLWLHLASHFDFAGDLDGARLLLDRIERGARTLRPPREARELLALVCARRGRLARQTGDVEAAREWYQLGLARTDGARDRDAWSSCLLGLANCAQFQHDL